ncbi:Ubiquinone biosynthesis O-methyltransferase [Thalassocella blandensis]|nr:Ubiquinone biosynthesis O-methyltransferase [Thalassocella blandensis]
MSKKTDQREAFGLTILKNGHPDVKKLRSDTGMPSIHGNKFWKATYLLIDYLNEFPPSKKKPKILEIGCGWGLGGIYCAKNFNAKVTSLDADEKVFPYLDLHAKLNGVKSKTWKNRYEKIRVEDLQEFDMMIAADVCFWDEMTKPLFNLVKRAHKAGVRTVMTDPGRPPFRDMAEKSIEKFGGAYVDWTVPHPHNASGIVLDIE